jgi:hypothetical protein
MVSPGMQLKPLPEIGPPTPAAHIPPPADVSQWLTAEADSLNAPPAAAKLSRADRLRVNARSAPYEFKPTHCSG